jgi:hypothetical protein
VSSSRQSAESVLDAPPIRSAAHLEAPAVRPDLPQPPAPGRSSTAEIVEAPPVDITHETVIVGPDAELLWQHYWASFEPLTELSVQKQHSDHDEMSELFANPRVLKIVGREAGRPVGFAMITNSLDDVPELSPRFLRRRYPEHAARDAIYVGVYVVVAPEHRGITLFHRLYLDCWQLVANNAGVLVVDTCEFNRQAFDTDALANRVARAFPNSTVAELDRQTWYAMELPEPMA